MRQPVDGRGRLGEVTVGGQSRVYDLIMMAGVAFH